MTSVTFQRPILYRHHGALTAFDMVNLWADTALPGARFRGLCERGLPVISGVMLTTGYRLPWGTVWHCPRAGLWMWQPNPEERSI